MRYLFFLFLIVSCSKSMEERCFTSSDDISTKNFKNDEDLINYNYYDYARKYDIKKIIAEKPDYLQIIHLKTFRSFKKDSLISKSEEITEKKWKEYSSEFKILMINFQNSFLFLISKKSEMSCMHLAEINSDSGFVKLKIKNLLLIF